MSVERLNSAYISIFICKQSHSLHNKYYTALIINVYITCKKSAMES